MLQKISIQSLATIFIVILLIIAVAYYIFPGHDSLLILIGSIVGSGPILIIAILVIIGLIISTAKLIIRHIHK
jgi:hypothetical protein